VRRSPLPLDLPDYQTRLQLALDSIRLGSLAGYEVLADLIDEASAGA
jgi:hypothetical protein